MAPLFAKHIDSPVLEGKVVCTELTAAHGVQTALHRGFRAFAAQASKRVAGLQVDATLLRATSGEAEDGR